MKRKFTLWSFLILLIPALAFAGIRVDGGKVETFKRITVEIIKGITHISILAVNATKIVQIGDGTYSWGHAPMVGIEGILEVDEATYLDTILTLVTTTSSTTGVIYKGANAFLHDFHHLTGGSAIPEGYNVFLGEGAGNFTMGSTATITSHASNNIGIGNQVLHDNTVGRLNIAIGLSALANNNTGRYNIGIGENALGNITDATYNIAIGIGAGRFQANGSTVLVPGHGNIYIGGIARGYDNNDDNSIVIGYNVIGVGANKVVIGNSSITDTYLKGVVHVSSGIKVAGESNVLHARKFTITHADLTATATSEDEALFTLPAGGMVQDVYAYVTTQFTGGSVSACTVAIGTTDADLLAEEHDVLGCGDTTWILEGQAATDKGTGLYEPTDKTRKNYIVTAATALIAEFTSTTDNLVNLDAGSIDIYVLYLVAE